MRLRIPLLVLTLTAVLTGCLSTKPEDLVACSVMTVEGLRPVAAERSVRFLGKVAEDTARCRGGDRAVALRGEP